MKSGFFSKVASVVGLTAMAIGMVGCGSEQKEYTAQDMLKLAPQEQDFYVYVDCGNYLSSNYFLAVEKALSEETADEATREKFADTKAIVFENGGILYHKGSSDSDFAKELIETLKSQAALMPNANQALAQLDDISTQTIEVEGNEVIAVSGNGDEVFFMELANDLFLVTGSQQDIVAYNASEKGVSKEAETLFNSKYNDNNIFTAAAYVDDSGEISVSVSAVDSLDIDATIKPYSKEELEQAYNEMSQGIAMIPMLLAGVDPSLVAPVTEAIKLEKTDSELELALDLDQETSIKLLNIVKKMADQELQNVVL